LKKNRIWEIDCLRGIAVIAMIFDHLMIDLGYMFYFDSPFFWRLEDFAQWYFEFPLRQVLQIVFIVIFLGISGISSSFSRNHYWRGLKVLIVAYLITAVTYFMGESYLITFGVLHMLGVSMLIYGLLRKLKNWHLLLIGGVMVAVGIVLELITLPRIDNYFLFMLGFTHVGGVGDYFPLLPWTGVFLLGTVLGRKLYPEKKSLFAHTPKWQRPFSFVGRHALVIYVAHQPLIYALVMLIAYLAGAEITLF
jgi:uncharacterized membrane protein